MSVDRLKVLQMLSDGSIDAETASKILSGEIDAPDSPEQNEQINVELDEAVVEVDEIEIEIEEDEAVKEDSAEIPPNIIALKIEEEPQAEPLPNKRLRVIVEGSPVKVDLDITLPGELFKFGSQIGAYFNNGTDADDGQDINFSMDTESQQVRIFTEKVA